MNARLALVSFLTLASVPFLASAAPTRAATASVSRDAVVATDEGRKSGPRDGEGVRTGPRDGEGRKAGPRDGEGVRTGPRDGEGRKAAPQESAKERAGGVTFGPPPPMPDEAALAKARKQKKAAYTKFAEAKEMAWKCQLPLVVALLPSGDVAGSALESKVLRDRCFAKDFVAPNCVFLAWHLKPGKVDPPPQEQGRRRPNNAPPKATDIDVRPLKADEVKFLKAFAVSPKAIQAAKRNKGPEPKFSEMRNYPAVLCVDPSATKLHFRMPAYEAKEGRAGFGVWMSQLVDLFRAAKYNPALTPQLEKIVESPTEPKKWK